MSEEMAVGEKAMSVEAEVNGDEVAADTATPVDTSSEQPGDSVAPQAPNTEPPAEDAPVSEANEDKLEVKTDTETTGSVITESVNKEPESTEPEDIKPESTNTEITNLESSVTRGIKRRASSAFSDNDEEFRGFTAGAPVEEDFKGFNEVDEKDLSVDYSRVLDRLEAEVTAAAASFTPLKTVMATPPAPGKAGKRLRKDTECLETELTAVLESFSLGNNMAAPSEPLKVKSLRKDSDGSRPSSALSSRSDRSGDGISHEGPASSPAGRGRRPVAEMSSPLLRAPLERGWRRELVYRAALDAHSRRNADIYYYTPAGKKLRSTREIAEHLSGTGFTLENFSFFKEPLGVNDPEKEIIRDAKMMRRVESPISAPAAAEGKRTPKPKPPKGASPEPATPKSPPAKIKVKSMGSRLNNSGAAQAQAPAAKQQKKPGADNNNSAAWKKPRQPPLAPQGPGLPVAASPGLPVLPSPGLPVAASSALPMAPSSALPMAPSSGLPAAPPQASATPPPPPPPLQSRPPPPQLSPQPDIKSPRQVMQPCSLTCGRGVPSLACGACLCLYHPVCAGLGLAPAPGTFFCKNCRKSSSPASDPPPLVHKSGAPSGAPLPAPAARRAPAAAPPAPPKRVLLRMKVAGGGPDGERVWAVAKPHAAAAPPVPAPAPAPVPRPRVAAAPPRGSQRVAVPQSLAIINGRRFIVVHRTPHDVRTRGRIANGASSPPDVSPRRRGRAKADDTDYFTPFYNKAQEKGYNVVTQIFQYLGMRELATCARVCRLWRQLAATPTLWRHVRMKNSHVSNWGVLCAALKRHGAARLDLRKMLLPDNDEQFWRRFADHIASVDSLERIEMCRCPASAVEAVCRGLPGLRSLSALAIRDAFLDPAPLGALPLLHELRLKSMSGLTLTRDLRPLAALTHLQHLSLTSIKELGWCASDVVGQLETLESLELGECTFRAEFGAALARLRRLRRLRLERGTAQCAAPALLRALAALPLLTRLELVNIDVKVGFDDALAECKNIQRLLIIPTYVSQSATTNKQVLSGVLRLKDTLTHLMWGVTIELLRVTELFIDQCEQAGEAPRRDLGECIPVLKPVPGCRLPHEHRPVAGPPQVEILPLPTLQRLLSAQLPNTRLKLLRIPFHATWRQSLADFQ